MNVLRKILLLVCLLAPSIGQPMKRGGSEPVNERANKRQKVEAIKLTWEGAGEEEFLEVSIEAARHSGHLRLLIDKAGKDVACSTRILVHRQSKEMIFQAVECLKLIKTEGTDQSALEDHIHSLSKKEEDDLIQAEKMFKIAVVKEIITSPGYKLRRVLLQAIRENEEKMGNENAQEEIVITWNDDASGYEINLVDSLQEQQDETCNATQDQLQDEQAVSLAKLSWTGAGQDEYIEVAWDVAQHSESLKHMMNDGYAESLIQTHAASKEVVEHLVQCLHIIHSKKNVEKELDEYVKNLTVDVANNVKETVDFLDVSAMQNLVWNSQDQEEEPLLAIIVAAQEVELCNSDLSKLFPCTWKGCNRSYCQRRSLARHIKNDHESLSSQASKKKFKCTWEGCKKSYGIQSHVKRHIREFHEGKKRRYERVPCPWKGCGKDILKEHLATHMQIHREEKLFVCTEKGCNKSFTTKIGLNGHKITHTDQKPFACSEAGCSRVYKRRADLNKHIGKVHQK